MRKLLLIVGASLASFVVFAAPIGYKHYQQPWLAPDFRLTDQAGISHQLTDYRGKVLVVNFWATWCSPCVKEMPSLQRTWEKLKSENIEVVGITVGESRDDINRFLEKREIGFPLLADSSSSVVGNWGVPGLPTTYVIDEEGYVVIRVIGPYEWDSPETLQRLRNVLKSKSDVGLNLSK